MDSFHFQKSAANPRAHNTLAVRHFWAINRHQEKNKPKIEQALIQIKKHSQQNPEAKLEKRKERL